VWSDFMVNPGDQVAYRVTPMLGPAGALTEDAMNASSWSEVVEIGAETAGRISCYFNRGIVAPVALATPARGTSGPGTPQNRRNTG
jgi:hypothetical protein